MKTESQKVAEEPDRPSRLQQCVQENYMPIKLKGILMARSLPRKAFAATILQTDGTPMSVTALTQLMNYAYFPKSTPEADIRHQIEDQLRACLVPEDEIATAWDKTEGVVRHVWRGNSADVLPFPSAATPSAASSPRQRRTATTEQSLFEPMEVDMLSPAAKKHFKIFRDPFQFDVNSTADIFMSSEQRYIGEAMFQTAKHGGFLAIAGESGSGKSTLRKVLEERLKGQNIRLIFPQVIDKTRLTTQAVCQAIVNDIAPGKIVKSALEAQARQVHAVLSESSRADQSHVLLIEEAHDLSITIIKQLKRFYELEDGFKKLLAIILIGQPELRDKLNEQRYPEAREVIRRIEVAELQPLGSALEEYLAHKFARISTPVESIFAADAYEAIRARWTRTKPGTRDVVSNLYPLIVNNTVTKAMNRAATLGVPLITGDLIREL